jgi:uncharacterized protein with FMN-binding domain
MNSSIKKYIIGGVIVVAFAAYAIFNNNNGGNATILPSSTNPTPSSSSLSTATSGGSEVASGTPSTSAGAGTATSGQYKDGTYTGTVADAFYGNLQVVAVIQNGQLADVQFPVYPKDTGHTLQLSDTGMPVLKQEAIAAQSANVDVVSGATQLSEAFTQSLSSALAQAK